MSYILPVAHSYSLQNCCVKDVFFHSGTSIHVCSFFNPYKKEMAISVKFVLPVVPSLKTLGEWVLVYQK